MILRFFFPGIFPKSSFSLVSHTCYYHIIFLCQVKHIYELTPTQARELKRLVEEAGDSDNDYIVP